MQQVCPIGCLTHVLPAQGYGQSMGPGEEVSLSYTLYMPPQLPPREFQVSPSRVMQSTACQAHSVLLWHHHHARFEPQSLHKADMQSSTASADMAGMKPEDSL